MGFKMFISLTFYILLMVQYDVAEEFTEYEDRPRMMLMEGNMHFHAGKGKNIKFWTDGPGKIFLKDLDIDDLPTIALVNKYKRSVNKLNRASRRAQTLHLLTMRSLRNEFALKGHTFSAQLNRTNAMVGSMKENMDNVIQLINATLGGLVIKYETLKRVLEKNECLSSPCLNGGTCIDQYNSFMCLCSQKYQGATCSEKIDECELYSDTEFGCQNNATCTNTATGFECLCPDNFFGPKCAASNGRCMAYENADQLLCGHGKCVDNRNDNSYYCLCDLGWMPSGDKANPTCVDIDECANSPCHVGVTCVNFEGSFRCGDCPIGYQKHGERCYDNDECAENNGGCSQNPLAQCINTVGSFHCSPCPAGYAGDGKVCSPINPCDSSPCASEATCTNMPGNMAGGYKCVCPSNMVGTGVGHSGCTVTSINICENVVALCKNGGTCQSITEFSYKCHCVEPYYTGKKCEIANHCVNSPCQHNGTCINGPDAYSCQCHPGFQGVNCQVQEDGCGGEYTQPTGVITYPDPQFNIALERIDFKGNRSCFWNIKTVNEKILNISFTTFNIGKADRCEVSSSLTLYDGLSSDSPILGTYCNAFKPSNYILTSNNQLGIDMFLLSQSRNAQKFVVKWESIDPVCGKNLYQPTGSIDFLNYPINQHCHWTLRTDPGKHYKLSINPIKFDTGPCSGDYLEIHSGMHADDPIILKQCEDTQEEVELYTSGPYAYIYFNSDDFHQPIAGTAYGFQIQFSSQQLDLACGGTLREAEGTMASPNYGQGNYFNDLDCVWVIDVTELQMSHIQLTVTDMHIEGTRKTTRSMGHQYHHHPMHGINMHGPVWNGHGQVIRPAMSSLTIWDCKDSLQFREGEDENGKIIFAENDRNRLIYCGDEIPMGPVISTTSKLWVRFQTDKKGTDTGFQANYVASCDKVLRNPISGIIQSPKFPEAVGRALECKYTFEMDRNRLLILNFTNIHFSNRFSSVCSANGIAITRNVRSGKSEPYVRKICTPLSDPFTITGSTVELKFITDGSMQNTGFQAEFKTQPAQCYSDLRAPEGTISTAGLTLSDGNYAHNVYCEWHIKPSYSTRSLRSNQAVRLEFTEFNFEKEHGLHRNCSFDSVLVYDGYGPSRYNTNTYLMGRYCNSMLPPILISTRPLMTVIMQSDHSLAGKGFVAKYRLVNKTAECDTTLTGNTGIIESEGYPSTSSLQKECQYYIQADNDMTIMFNITDLQMDCQIGYLLLKNGPTADSPSFDGLYESKICGQSMKGTVLKSKTNRVYAKLVTSAAQYKFRIIYEQISARCGGHLISGYGSISSPQYPLMSNDHYDCIWYISVPQGNRIKFSVKKINFGNVQSYEAPDMINCGRQSLKVFDGPNVRSEVLHKNCINLGGLRTVTSSSTTITLQYIQFTDASVSGFLAEYSTDCVGVDLTGYEGTLQSAGYPQTVYYDRSCQWNIKAAPGNKLVIQIHLLDIDCNTASLILNSTKDIYETKFDESFKAIDSTYKTYRGQELCDVASNKQLKASDQVSVYFESVGVTNEGNKNHFMMTWHTEGCGGNIIAKDGTEIKIKNNAGDKSISYHECHYTVQAPIGKRLELRVEYLGFQDSRFSDKCYHIVDRNSQNGLEIYNALDKSRRLLQPDHQYCKVIIQPTIFHSMNNQMFVRFSYFLHNQRSNDNGNVLEAIINILPDGGNCSFSNHGQSSGMIASPNFPKAFNKGDTCNYQITVNEGNIVVLNISTFYLNNDVNLFGSDGINCPNRMTGGNGALSIYDGMDQHAPLLFKICRDFVSNDTVTIIRSTGNSLFIHFLGSHKDLYDENVGEIDTPNWESGKKYGFYATYTSGCGAELNATADRQAIHVTSDIDKIQCDWLIKAEEGQQIYLQFEFLSMKFHPSSLFIGHRDVYAQMYPVNKSNATLDTYEGTCPSHYVAIYDGMQINNDTVVYKYCGSHIPPPIVSSGNYLYIVLKNQQKWEHFFNREIHRVNTRKTEKIAAASEFRIVYTSSSSACGGTLYSQRGRLTSPGFPENYQNDMECVWKIHNSPGNQIEISIISIDIEESDMCSKDYIELLDANHNPLKPRLCRPDMTDTFTFPLDELIFRFKSDGIGTRSGFQAEYTLLFGKSTSEASGVITSPWYDAPREAVQSLNMFGSQWGLWQRIRGGGISWRITAKPFQNIKLDFTELSLPFYSYYRYSGQGECLSPPNILVFENDCSQRSGIARYAAMECNGEKARARFCGTNLPQTYVSASNVITLIFFERLVSYKLDRFSLTFTASWPSTLFLNGRLWFQLHDVCYGDMRERADWLTGQKLCSDVGASLPMLKTKHIDADFMRKYKKQVLPIGLKFIGNDTQWRWLDGTPVDYHNWQNAGPSQSESADQIYMYSSNNGTWFNDFNNNADTVICQRPCVSECQYNVEASLSPQYIVSPGFDSDEYKNHQNCFWIISRNRFYTLHFKIVYFELEKQSARLIGKRTCLWDYVQFFGGYSWTNGNGTEVESKFCDLTFYPSFVLNSSVIKAEPKQEPKEAKVLFVSDGTGVGRGFKIQYQLVCGASIELAEHGEYLTNPYFPDPSPAGFNCSWTFFNPRLRPMQITFQNFSISKGNCDKNYLKISDADNFWNHCSGDFQAVGAPVIVKAYSFTINLVSDPTTGGDTIFQMHIADQIFGCSSDIINLSDQQQEFNLEFPPMGSNMVTLPPHSMDCIYKIHAIGKTVQMNIPDIQKSLSFGTGLQRNSTDSFVAVHDGGSLQSAIIAKLYNESDWRGTLYSSDSMLLIRIVTSPNVPADYTFEAIFSTAKCGGVIHISDSVDIKSPNFPLKYEPNQECNWLIVAPTNHFLEYHFKALFLPPIVRAECDNPSRLFYNDYVQIQNWNATGNLLGRYCFTKLGNDLENIKGHSKQNKLHIKFHSSAHIQTKGFHLVVNSSKTECGGTFRADEGFIESPNYPNPPPFDIECNWNIETEFNSIININFETLTKDPTTKYTVTRVDGSVEPVSCNMPNLMIYEADDVPESSICWPTDSESFPEINTASNKAMVKLKTGKNENNRDIFKLKYTSLPGQGCTKNIRQSDANNNQIIHVPREIDQWTISTTAITPTTTTTPLEGLQGVPSKPSAINICTYRLYSTNDELDTTTEIKFNNFYSYFNRSQVTGQVCTKTNKAVIRDRISGELVILCPENTMQERFSKVFLQSLVEMQVVFQSFHQQFQFTPTFHACGGYLRSPHGLSFQSPGYGNPMLEPSPIKCIWIIEVPDGNHIKLKLKLDIPTETGGQDICVEEFMTIQASKFADSPKIYPKDYSERHNVLGKLCGQLQTTIESSGNFLRIYFERSENSDSDYARKGFQIDYESIALTDSCNMVYAETNGTLLSPNYVNRDHYDKNLDCEWQIIVPVGYQIHFQANKIQIQAGSNCSNDYLKFYETRNYRTQQFIGTPYIPYGHDFMLTSSMFHESKTICGSFGGEFNYTSDSNSINVHLHTDGDDTTEKGFNISWNAVCGGNFYGSNGVVMSPNYPLKYPPNADCTYTINPQIQSYTNLFIALKFTYFDVAETDQLLVKEVNTRRMIFYFHRRMSNVPDVILSSGPMRINFRSSMNSQATGFKAEYSVSSCGEDVYLTEEDSIHVLRSPGQTEKKIRHHGLNCKWLITAEEGYTINIALKQMSIEPSHDCHNGGLYLLNGNQTHLDKENQTNEIAPRICGNITTEHNYFSSGNQLTAEFYSNNVHAKNQRFMAHAIQTKFCGPYFVNATEKSGQITLPMEHGTYLRLLQCQWLLTASPDRAIEINITKFNIEESVPHRQISTNGCFDWLVIYDGTSSEDPKVLDYTCGDRTSNLPIVLHTVSPSALIKFHSDRSLENIGIVISYKARNLNCGGGPFQCSSAEQIIEFSTNLITKDVFITQTKCHWHLTANEGDRILITVKQFNWQEDDNLEKCANFLKIYENVGLKSKVLCKTLKFNNIFEILSKTNNVYLFASYPAADTKERSFEITYKSINECHRSITGLKTGSVGYLTSPNYPDKYQSKQECVTSIEAESPFDRVTIIFNHFQLEDANRDGTGCTYDHVQIRSLADARRLDPTSVTYCGSLLPPTFTSAANAAYIHFKTDLSISKDGYDLTYTINQVSNGNQPGCGGIIRSETGALSSPQYPSTYPNNIECTWTFANLPIVGSGITDWRITFTHFDLGADDASTGNECSGRDRMEFTGLDQSLQTVCGKEAREGESIVIPADAKLKFISNNDSTDNGSGFRLNFEWVGSGSPGTADGLSAYMTD